MNERAFDYIVVGAGAAGCVVASRLSEDSACRVALVEAGALTRNPIFRIPGLGFLASTAPRTNWSFATAPNPQLNDRALVLLAGKLLGGSSSINGMIFTRGHSKEYDQWRDLGCDGWASTDVQPYFRRVETNPGGSRNGLRGVNGPIALSKASNYLPITDMFLESAARVGFEITDDLNRDVLDAFGYHDINVSRGRRLSAATAYLEPAAARKNLRVFTEAHTTGLVIEGDRVRGIHVLSAGKAVTLHADSEVILCAGAINSPHLLLTSGIGPADELARAGVAVVADAPEVGGNLQNHPYCCLRYTCRTPVTGYRNLRPLTAAGAGLSYLASRSGPLAENLVPIGGFFRTDPERDSPDVQVTVGAALFPKAGTTKPGITHLLPKEHGFTVLVYQGTPFSRGRVFLAEADPLKRPIIDTGYFSDARDMSVLVKAVRRMRELVREQPLADVIDRELDVSSDPSDDAGTEDLIRRTAGNAFHQSGTCRMGSDARAVVDTALRVRGVTGLRVADASIMPTVPNAALHAPVMMIAEKAADLIRNRAPAQRAAA